MIQLTDLSFVYPNGKKVIDELTLAVKKGECVVLCGESGCGKSTLLRILNGLIPELYEGQLSGEGQVLGTDLPAANFNQYVKKMGVVFQNPKTQFFTNDVYSELAFAMENYGVPRPKMVARIQGITTEFHLNEFIERSMFQLSGGQKQLIAFASAIMLQHELLLLDEPSSNLDLETIQHLEKYLQTLKNQGMTLLISEHRLYYLADVVDRFVVMQEGKIAHIFSREEMLAKSAVELQSLGLRELRLTPLAPVPCANPQALAAVTEAEISDSKRAEEASEKAVWTLECQNLHFHYRKQSEVLNLPNLTLRSQQVTGIVGHNGAGKSTFVKVLAGLEKFQAGCIMRDGVALKRQDLLKESFLVMQDVNLQLFCETVAKEIMLKAPNTQDFKRVVALLNLEKLLNRHPQTLSGGEKQRVAIASSLLSGKKVVIFDEPTSGLDLKHMQEVSQTIAWLAASNVIILVVSHDQEFLRCTCQRLLQFENGQITTDYTLEPTTN